MSQDFSKNSPINIQVSCHGWNPLEEKDVLLSYITVGIWLNIGNSTGRLFTHHCIGPNALWDYLQQLTSDPLAVLKEEFDYTPPQRKRKISSVPLNLGDLF